MQRIATQKKVALIAGLLLSATYVATAALILDRTNDGSWGGFGAFVLSFPASLLALLLPSSLQVAGILAIGGLWWFFLGYGITRFVNYIGVRRSGA